MKTDPDRALPVPATDPRPYVGRFVRRQGNFGTILVVGRGGSVVELINNAKRQFPKNGTVETQGVAHAGLAPGDWTEFHLVRNLRPGGPGFKVTRLRRLPRYAVLPEMTPAEYRALLTKTGWHGDRRGGLWALRISDDRVIMVDLEPGADGGLRIPRKAKQEVHWCAHSDGLVAEMPADRGSEQVFLGDASAPLGAFDWSDECDHIAQVIRSLAGLSDPFVDELIAWLELHHDEGSGRVFAAALNHDAAAAALRSGELAKRLRADRELMKAYLDAALQDVQVRDAITAWAREGHSQEAERLREELKQEVEREREAGLAQVAVQVQAKLREEFANVEEEAKQQAETRRAEIAAELRGAEEAHAELLRALAADFDLRREKAEEDRADLANRLKAAEENTEKARSRLDQIILDEAEAQKRLTAVSTQIDRMLAVAGRIDLQERHPVSAVPSSRTGVGFTFQARPQVAAEKKGKLIANHILLTDHGKNLMRQLTTLMLAGELPLLTGSDAQTLIKVAEALLCPGRAVSIEADPTIISVDDLWSRPGSGAQTALATAAMAAEDGGTTLVSIRNIERSGARIWYPALADAFRVGALPRGLLVVCVTADPGHEEVAALPPCAQVIAVERALTDSAYLAGPALLSPPALELEALAPGDVPKDLSLANTLIATLGFKPTLDLSLRLARIYMEAVALLCDEIAARSLVIGIAHRMAEGRGLRAP